MSPELGRALRTLADGLLQLAEALEDPELVPETRAPVSPVDEDVLLDRRGAAALLSLSVASVDRLCRRTKDPLPFVRIGDVRRFRRGEIRGWLSRQ